MCMHTYELLLFGDNVFVTYVQRMSYYYDDTTYCSEFVLTFILSSASNVELMLLRAWMLGLLRRKRVWVILNHWYWLICLMVVSCTV
jgi:hypothetical protein